MSWVNILKISTEENKKKRQDIINEWEKMGLFVGKGIHQSRSGLDDNDYFISVPYDRYNNPAQMFDTHFYGMIAKRREWGVGFYVKMPKYPYTGSETISVSTKEEAREVGRTYLDRYERAVKDYTGPYGKWSYKKDKE